MTAGGGAIAQTPASPKDLVSQGATAAGRGIPVARGESSGSGGGENSSSVKGDGVPPSVPIPRGADPSFVSTLATCAGWWVTGSHQWKWRGISGLYMRNELYASTNTFYGSYTDPNACGRPPLIVDRIKIYAIAQGTDIAPEVNKTAYNASFIDGSDTARGSFGLAQAMCGATAHHEAFKNGVTWFTQGRSGC